MWVYHQSTGVLERNGRRVAKGYSGAPTAVNNPDLEAEANVGPIPRGQYYIGHLEARHGYLGPDVMLLSPVGHDAHGRTSFYIHGDNLHFNHTASEGCIILPTEVRLEIGRSPDHALEVVR